MVRQSVVLTVAVWLFLTVELLLPSIILGSVTGLRVLFFALVELVGLFLSLGLLWVTTRVQRLRPLPRWSAIVVAALTATALLAYFDAWLYGQFSRLFWVGSGVFQGELRVFLGNIVGHSWIFAMLTALYTYLQGQAQARQKEQELAEARELAKAAQLDALRLQLNPHFLFNTLNAISSLVVTGRNAEGERMLSRLSEFLRSSIRPNSSGAATLSEELETLQNYLEIEAVRFEDRLSVAFDCPDELLDVEVPSFILQPLIENAIKYAVAPTSRPVTISLEARREGDNLLLTVSDNGAAGASGRSIASNGIGLANVRRRLEVLYGQKGKLETLAHEGGFVAVVRLPLINRLERAAA